MCVVLRTPGPWVCGLLRTPGPGLGCAPVPSRAPKAWAGGERTAVPVAVLAESGEPGTGRKPHSEFPAPHLGF